MAVAAWGRGENIPDGGFECEMHGYIPLADHCPRCWKHARMCDHCTYVGPDPDADSDA